MRYISELREGGRIQDVYLCKHKQSAVTKNGKNYENVILQDRTGVIDAKIWDPNSDAICEFEALDYIYVAGTVSMFAQNYGNGVEKTSQLAFLTMLFSILTMPVIGTLVQLLP